MYFSCYRITANAFTFIHLQEIWDKMKKTLSEAVAAYVQRGTLREPTRESYRSRLGVMIEHVGGNKDITEVHPFDLLRFADSLDSRKDLKSDVTYNNYIKQMTLFFDWCVKAHLIEKNPADILEFREVESGGEGWQPMSEVNYQKLLDYVSHRGRGYNPREEVTIRFFGEAGGLRCASVAAIQWSDLDLKERTAIIRHQKVRSKKDQIVTWGDECQRALLEWNLKQKRSGGNHVFSNNGNPIQPRSLNKYFRRLTEQAGIGAHGTHTLRNRFGIRATRRFGVVHTAKLMNLSEYIVARHYVKESEESLLSLMRDLANTSDYAFKRHQPTGTET